MTSIIVSDVIPHRLEIARQWGADMVINAREEDVVAVVHQRFPGGVESAIDAVGLSTTRIQAVQSVVPGGRVVLMGLHDEESVLPTNYLIRQEVALTGSFAYTDGEFAESLDMLTQGMLQPSDDWLEERPLREGPTVFAELVDGTTRAAKIVLTVAPSRGGG
jgi:threonine dehydrogenase-like Zn-dependent dehydrogenase